MVAPFINAYTSPATTKVWPVSNNAGVIGGTPSGWEAPGFDDSGWETPIDVGDSPPYFGGFGFNHWAGAAPSPSKYIAPEDILPGTSVFDNYVQDLVWLLRIKFYLPSIPTAADWFISADNGATWKINGVVPTGGGGSIILTPGSFVVGWNVLTATITNGNSPGAWAGGNPTMAIARLYSDVDVGIPPEPPPPPPEIHFDVCDPDGMSCVRFDNALGKTVRIEYNGTGSGAFVVNRYDEQATATNLKQGNIVKVTFTEIDPNPIFEFILEVGDFDLLDNDEEGGENLSFGGRGTLALLAYTILDNEWNDLAHPDVRQLADRVWRWSPPITDYSAAGILRRIMYESQLHDSPALVGVTHGGDPSPWTDVTDSLGNPFFELDGDYEIKIGTDLLTAAMDLCRRGLFQIEMRPGFSLWAYDEMGFDRTGTDFGSGVVRFEKGVNITTKLTRQLHGRDWASRVLLETKDGFLWVNGTSPPYTKEVLLDLSDMEGTNSQERAAAHALLRGTEAGDALVFEVTPTGPNGVDDEDTGYYYPGFVGTENGKYWIGDLVTLHTGTDEDLDYVDRTFRIHAITLQEDETGRLAPPTIELNAAYTIPDNSTGGTGSSSEGGAGGGLSGGGSGAGPHVHTQYQPKAEKSVADGYASLDGDGLVPSDELGTGGVGAGAKFLADDQTFKTIAAGDHGALTGLADDDHPQYATNAEFDDHSARHEPGGADPMAVDAAAGVGSLRTLGSGATQAAQGTHTHGGPTGAAGGDLAGTYPNPTVVDDSHSHTEATLPASASTGQLVIADTHSTPLVFEDIVQNEAEDDFVYSD